VYPRLVHINERVSFKHEMLHAASAPETLSHDGGISPRHFPLSVKRLATNVISVGVKNLTFSAEELTFRVRRFFRAIYLHIRNGITLMITRIILWVKEAMCIIRWVVQICHGEGKF